MTGCPETLGRIFIVGPCASGKSTLVRALRMHEYDAHATSQEHSAIPTLWSTRQPTTLIALQADLESVRLRRQDARWSREIWIEQQERLLNAFENADYIANTSNRNANDVVRDVLGFLSSLTRSRKGN